ADARVDEAVAEIYLRQTELRRRDQAASREWCRRPPPRSGRASCPERSFSRTSRAPARSPAFDGARPMAPVGGIIITLFGIAVVILVAIYVLVPLAKAVGWVFRHIFAFVGGMIGSFLRVIGGLVAAFVFLPLILLNVITGRWSAAAHFGRGLQDEARAVGVSTYRVFVGHPARVLMLTPLVEGLERRVPQAVAHA